MEIFDVGNAFMIFTVAVCNLSKISLLYHRFAMATRSVGKIRF